MAAPHHWFQRQRVLSSTSTHQTERSCHGAILNLRISFAHTIAGPCSTISFKSILPAFTMPPAITLQGSPRVASFCCPCYILSHSLSEEKARFRNSIAASIVSGHLVTTPLYGVAVNMIRVDWQAASHSAVATTCALYPC